MVKMITDLLGARVILFQEGAKLGSIQSLIIDADTGDFVGFFAQDPTDRKKKVVPAGEIKAIGQGFVVIKDLKSLTEPEEVVKVQKALAINPPILKERVITQSGQKLGRVSDATIDLTSLSLERLFVTTSFSANIFAKDLIIPAQKIVEIKKDVIIVSDEFVRIKETKVASVAKPAID